MWDTVLEVLRTPVVATVVGGLFLWLLGKLYAAKPEWQKYEGTLISAIKAAEKAIPDSASNKGLARLDAALRFAIEAYESGTGRAPSLPTVNSWREGIQILHAQLEADGNLDK